MRDEKKTVWCQKRRRRRENSSLPVMGSRGGFGPAGAQKSGKRRERDTKGINYNKEGPPDLSK